MSTAPTTALDTSATTLDDYITRTVAAAPPLTASQRDRLALLLSTVPAGSEVA